MNTLQEIKSGKTGYGLLVENDGYISLHEGRNKEVFESIKLNESMDGEFHCPYPFVVSAVFQKYGVKNANGRIYPEEVLTQRISIWGRYGKGFKNSLFKKEGVLINDPFFFILVYFEFRPDFVIFVGSFF